MELLLKESGGARSDVAVLFGLGMIGTAIRDALLRFQFGSAARLPVEWSAPDRFGEIADAIRRSCQGLRLPPRRIAVTWSAGVANFFSSAAEVEEENRSFKRVLQLVCELRDALPDTTVHLHYFSSAGGLFEGQRLVNADSKPTPQRPYGWMKRSQEDLIRASLSAGAYTLYRPSSVYGSLVRPHQHGLINQLISNTSNRRTSVLDANVMALRDYVYAGDIGLFVARRIVLAGPGRSPPEQFLVSARCASIFEVAARIERVLHIKVRYRFDEHFGNSANITFSGTVLPAGWRPSTLEVGIRQFMLRDRPQTRAISAADS